MKPSSHRARRVIAGALFLAAAMVVGVVRENRIDGMLILALILFGFGVAELVRSRTV